jgi:predicted nucleotidyltransferase
MEAHDRKILEEFAGRVRRLFPGARIWAFGSRARGDAREDSDFDVCVVTAKPRASTEAAIREIAWEVAFARGLVITALCYKEEEFSRGPRAASSLVRHIMTEGVAA